MDPVWLAVAAAVGFVLWRLLRGGASAEDVLAALQAGAPILDVRTPAEFATGHAKGAMNIPVDQLSGRLKELGEPGVIVIYCQSGMRSGQAAGVLKAAGFDVLDAKRLGAIPAAFRA
jgi:rhodanese-related sulfurtransferase